MNRLVFLLEEHSMRVFLDGLLPRLFPNLPYLCVTHDGKQDLERSIPRKLKAWREPGVCFMVIRDNDGGNCRMLKKRLVSICRRAGRADTIVRLAMQELEAWYLGEPPALAEAYGNEALRKIGAEARYREPDAIAKPSIEMRRLVPEFQKVSGARRLAGYLTRERNRSRSFQVLLTALARQTAELGKVTDKDGAN